MTKKESGSQAQKHFKEILLLFSVPAAIIVIVIAFVFIPRLFVNPTYDFIYCTGYSCGSKYSVEPGGNIAVSEKERFSYSESTLHYYDVLRDTSRPVHDSEANRYRLDPTNKSPDGYTLGRASSGGGFLFWSDYRNNWSLSKGIASKPITLDGSSDNKLIGWVLE